VKFGAFYEHLEKHFSGRFDRIGSGHYARLDRDRSEDSASQVRLAMTPDAVKDQTYFLAHLSQQQLARTIFPLGRLTKASSLVGLAPYMSLDKIGSGHNARLVRNLSEGSARQIRLAMMPDAVKDQMYFLRTCRSSSSRAPTFLWACSQRASPQKFSVCRRLDRLRL